MLAPIVAGLSTGSMFFFGLVLTYSLVLYLSAVAFPRVKKFWQRFFAFCMELSRII